MSILHGRSSRLGSDYDAGKGGPPEMIAEGRGSLEMFDSQDSPHLLFMAWYWPSQGESLVRRYRFEGWEDLSGRKCLRFAIVRYLGDPRDDRNFRRYWVDVE